MSKPIYGGWVTFTSHLCLKYNSDLYKIGKRTEQNKRNYGYGIEYRNLRIDDILELPNLVITALDKHYWRYLYLFPKDTILIIHDPTELKGKGNPLPDLLHKFKIITIRETVQKLLKEKYNIESEFKYHPFYEYDKNTYKNNVSDKCISINRIDFDKNTHDILRANPLINDESNKKWIYGKENRLYVQFTLKG